MLPPASASRAASESAIWSPTWIFTTPPESSTGTGKTGTGSSTGKNKSTTRKSGNSSSYEDPIDPDDYDIDAYYEDNRDVYDDWDEAWEGFLDDEEAWDDY